MNAILPLSLALIVATSFFTSTVQADHHEKKELSAKEKEVWEVVKTYYALWDKRDDAFMSYVHPQFLGWDIESAKPQDKEGLKEILEHMKKQGPESSVLTLMGITIIGDTAVVHYSYRVEKKQDEGRWSDILRNEDGKWLLICDTGGPTTKSIDKEKE